MSAREWTAVLVELAARLRAVGYSAHALRQRLGVTVPDDVGLLNRAPALERLRREDTPVAVLARAFYLEAPEPIAALLRAVPRVELKHLVQVGLLAQRRRTLTARLRLDIVDDLYVLADRRLEKPDAHALRLPVGDMVYPPGGDSVMLAGVVPPVEGGRALDLCTGSGIQALKLARASGAVVATDIGARAVALARANAHLNGIGNVEAREGDLFSPVRAERFDVIVANPPFVPSPRRGPAYHSGGPRGDRVVQRVVRGLGAHLRPGGRAFAISHLALAEGESAAGRLRPWVRDFPGRALALVLECGAPVDLAAAQALFALDDGFASYAAEVRLWVDYLRRRRIDRILLLLLAFERRGRGTFEVLEAFQRTLPIPLSKAPRDLVADWLGR